MRYSITSYFKNLSVIWQKYVFHWKKWNSESTASSVHAAELFALEKPSPKFLYRLFDVLPKKTTYEMEALQMIS